MFNTMPIFRFSSLFNDPFFDDMSRPIMSDMFDGVDVIEDDQNIRLKIDVPGMKKDDLKVELREGLLMIKARRDDKIEGLRSRGRRTIDFSKSFTLDESLDQDRIEASCTDGVLDVVLHKKKDSTKLIEIK